MERALVRIGAEADTDYLARCAARLINTLDPDGKQPTEAELLAREGIRFSRPRWGLVAFNGHMTILDYEELMVAIGTGTNPRTAANRAAAKTGIPAPERQPEPTSPGMPWPTPAGQDEADWSTA